MVGASKITILRLLAAAGTFRAQYHDLFVRGLSSSREQLDEIWSICGCKNNANKAVAAGIANSAFTVLEFVKMIEEEESRIGRRLTDYRPSK